MNFITIYILVLIPLAGFVFWFGNIKSTKFWDIQKETMEYLKSIDKLDEDNYHIFLEYCSEMNRHGFHRSHDAGYREIKTFVKGKFNIDIS